MSTIIYEMDEDIEINSLVYWKQGHDRFVKQWCFTTKDRKDGWYERTEDKGTAKGFVKESSYHAYGDTRTKTLLLIYAEMCYSSSPVSP